MAIVAAGYMIHATGIRWIQIQLHRDRSMPYWPGGSQERMRTSLYTTVNDPQPSAENGTPRPFHTLVYSVPLFAAIDERKTLASGA